MKSLTAPRSMRFLEFVDVDERSLRKLLPPLQHATVSLVHRRALGPKVEQPGQAKQPHVAHASVAPFERGPDSVKVDIAAGHRPALIFRLAVFCRPPLDVVRQAIDHALDGWLR
eukprot:7225837-Prymnesium_polylepis.1